MQWRDERKHTPVYVTWCVCDGRRRRHILSGSRVQWFVRFWREEWSVRFATLTRMEVVAEDLNGRADDRRCAQWPQCGGFDSPFQLRSFLALLLSHFSVCNSLFLQGFYCCEVFLFVLCIWSLWLVNGIKVCVYWLWKDRLGVMQIMGRSHLCRLSFLLLCYGDDDCLNQLWCKMLVME